MMGGVTPHTASSRHRCPCFVLLIALASTAHHGKRVSPLAFIPTRLPPMQPRINGCVVTTPSLSGCFAGMWSKPNNVQNDAEPMAMRAWFSPRGGQAIQLQWTSASLLAGCCAVAVLVLAWRRLRRAQKKYPWEA
eukprot:CAMPEP_0117534332 /NCGR_PEP_ID=MMETSP0784-20121206/40355_1 /TAXON_ID=39447 /ORGANISM="" /LENGTH=134 /DNA_ID=CAMNT_0005330805 /DNA_START=56 /DNA_END=460 /DNA_ORIENTATION=+